MKPSTELEPGDTFFECDVDVRHDRPPTNDEIRAGVARAFVIDGPPGHGLCYVSTQMGCHADENGTPATTVVQLEDEVAETPREAIEQEAARCEREAASEAQAAAAIRAFLEAQP